MKIFTMNDKCPELLTPQVASFRKYLQDDFEFIVFNNENFSIDREKSKEISNICRSLSIQMIETQRDPVVEAAFNETILNLRPCFNNEGRYFNGDGGGVDGFSYALQWAWKNVISKEQGPIGMFHADVFLTEPIRFADYLQKHALCFCPQSRGPDVNYMWEAMVLADMSKLPSPETMCWFGGPFSGQTTDIGGHTHYYLAAHPEIKRLHISHLFTEEDPTLDFGDPAQDYSKARYGFFKLGDKKILHYMSGSRWYTKDVEYHRKKLAWAKKVVGFTEVS